MTSIPSQSLFHLHHFAYEAYVLPKHTSVLPCFLRYKARFAFDGEDTELTFRDGDVITLTEYVNDEWGRGSFNGRTGLFPLSFVQLVQESPARNPTPESPGT